ncbi:MAG: hypothetical protein K2N35_03710 [Muribaculaceae bacterium]|nr:hypothetical protein [Muribaculaceae bacterium]
MTTLCLPYRRLASHIIALLVIVFSVTYAHGADLVVREFKLLPTDQTAINSATMKKDQNGRTAALIKIYTTLNESQTYFDNGVMGIVARENKPGQIWLYIPARSQSILITNRNYAPYRYDFPEEIISGKTYSMQLTTEGKIVNLVASVRNAPIYVDGDSVGVSPHEIYLGYGEHEVRAQQGMMLYQGIINVSQHGPSRFELPMEDESKKYSDVHVSVPGNADIYFEGKKVGVGEWSSRLLGGSYTVEVKKENCEPQIVNFFAEAGNPTFVECPAPVPYRGYLSVDVSPSTGAKIFEGDSIIAVNRLSKLVNVGNHTLIFNRKGYESVKKTFHVMPNAETVDTVIMQRIQYVNPNVIYADLAFTYGPSYGASIRVGGYYRNINIEAGYTLGMGRSNDVYWYENDASGAYDDSCTYTMDEFTAKAGYQLSFLSRLGLTPRLGYMMQRLRGGIHGNGAMCNNITIGAKLIFKPIPYFGIFIEPEYAVPVMVNQLYSDISSHGGFSKGGFYVSAGFSFSLSL